MNPFQKSTSRKEEINTTLINKAIEIINNVGGDLSYSNISKTTKKIANISIGEKGISTSGISRNERHRTIINIAIVNKDKNTKKISTRDYENLETAELYSKIFSLKLENQKLKQTTEALKNEIKIQNSNQKKEFIIENINHNLTENNEKNTFIVLKKIIDYLLVNDLAVQNDEGNIITITDGSILITKDIIQSLHYEA